MPMPEPSSAIRACCIDVDGTLVARGMLPTGEVVRALDRLRVKGVRVMLATGRQYVQIERLVDELALDGPHIVCDGAMVRFRAGEILRCNTLDQSILAACD